eukprot:TRINITY_DN8204_c0_g2_i1.p1 TRINITY_DN8204_c0_g2~~TRINITY_DN8204_c0_g2_i1.p1  ORF type:complete len:753 (+),score=298.30 TRINITY_DN8204_c0_g2_i1:114-2372(+)
MDVLLRVIQERRYVSATGDDETGMAEKLLLEEEAAVLEGMEMEARKAAQGLRARCEELFSVLDNVERVELDDEAAAREELAALRDQLVAFLHRLIDELRKGDIPATCDVLRQLAHAVDGLFLTAAANALRNNVHSLRKSIEHSCLLKLTLKLSPSHRLLFAPQVTDVPNILQDTLDSYLKTVGTVDFLLPSLAPIISAQKDDAPPPSMYATPFSEGVTLNKEVVATIDDVRKAAQPIPESIIDYICKLENDYKDVWTLPSGETEPLSLPMCEQLLATIECSWVDETPLVGVTVDSTELRQSLVQILRDEIERARNSEAPEDNPRRVSSLTDLEIYSDDPANQKYAALYSPPKPEEQKYVNPFLANPPADLEAHWQQEQQLIRESHERRERELLQKKSPRPLPKAGAPEPAEQVRAPAPEAAEDDAAARRDQEKLRRLMAEEKEAERLRSLAIAPGASPARDASPAAVESVPASQSAQVDDDDEDERRLLEREKEIYAHNERRLQEQLEQERLKEAEREAAAKRAYQAKKAREDRAMAMLQAEEQRMKEEEEKARHEREETEKVSAELKRQAEELLQKRVNQHREVIPEPQPDTPDTSKSAASLAGRSLAEVYKQACSQMSIKPNSGVLRMLPTGEGAFVEDLSLGLNYIGVKGVLPLLEVLKVNRGLRSLNLQDNNLENNEVRSLVQLLSGPAGAKLTHLNLSSNPISLAGGTALLELVSKQRLVVKLDLQGTLIQPKVLDRIDEQLKENAA